MENLFITHSEETVYEHWVQGVRFDLFNLVRWIQDVAGVDEERLIHLFSLYQCTDEFLESEQGARHALNLLTHAAIANDRPELLIALLASTIRRMDTESCVHETEFLDHAITHGNRLIIAILIGHGYTSNRHEMYLRLMSDFKVLLNQVPLTRSLEISPHSTEEWNEKLMVVKRRYKDVTLTTIWLTALTYNWIDEIVLIHHAVYEDEDQTLYWYLVGLTFRFIVAERGYIPLKAFQHLLAYGYMTTPSIVRILHACSGFEPEHFAALAAASMRWFRSVPFLHLEYQIYRVLPSPLHAMAFVSQLHQVMHRDEIRLPTQAKGIELLQKWILTIATGEASLPLGHVEGLLVALRTFCIKLKIWEPNKTLFVKPEENLDKQIVLASASMRSFIQEPIYVCETPVKKQQKRVVTPPAAPRKKTRRQLVAEF